MKLSVFHEEEFQDVTFSDVLFSSFYAKQYNVYIRKPIVYYTLLLIYIVLVNVTTLTFFFNLNKLAFSLNAVGNIISIVALFPAYHIHPYTKLFRKFEIWYLLLNSLAASGGAIVFAYHLGSSRDQLVVIIWFITYMGSVFVLFFVDAMPPEWGMLKRYTMAMLVMQYGCYSVSVSFFPEYITVTSDYKEITISVMKKSLLLSDYWSASIITLFLFFGKLTYFSFLRPDRCIILHEKMILSHTTPPVQINMVLQQMHPN